MHELPKQVSTIANVIASYFSDGKSIAYIYRQWAWYLHTGNNDYAQTNTIDIILLTFDDFNVNDLYQHIARYITINKEIESTPESYCFISEPFNVRIDIKRDFNFTKKNDFTYFTIENIFYDIEKKTFVDPTQRGLSDLAADAPIIKHTHAHEEFDIGYIVRACEITGLLEDYSFDKDDLRHIKTINLNNIREPLHVRFSDLLLDILSLNKPGNSLKFLLETFTKANEWLFNQIIEIASYFDIPLNEDLDLENIFNDKKLKLINIYNEFFLSNKEGVETSYDKQHRLLTTLRLLFDSPSLDIKLPYVERITTLGEEITKRAAASSQPTEEISLFAHHPGHPAGPCDYGKCPPCVPEKCDPQCCCCYDVDYVTAVKTRCHNTILISCNKDGTGAGPDCQGRDCTGPPIIFDPGCDACFEACTAVLDGDCDNIPNEGFSWWHINDPGVCSCPCVEFDGQTCVLTCFSCENILCDSVVNVNSDDCAYSLTVEPSVFCCGGIVVIDFMFVVDYSGSMGPEICEVASQIETMVNAIDTIGGQLRVGMTIFGQSTVYSEIPTILTWGVDEDTFLLIEDAADITTFVNAISPSTCGGSGPDATGGVEYDIWAAYVAATDGEWLAGLSRYIMLITDEIGDNPENGIGVSETIAACQEKGITVIVVDACAQEPGTCSPARQQLVDSTGGPPIQDITQQFSDIINELNFTAIPTSCKCIDFEPESVIKNPAEFPECGEDPPADHCFDIPIQKCLIDQEDCDCGLGFQLFVCGQSISIIPEQVNMICCSEIGTNGCPCEDDKPKDECCCGIDCPGSEVCVDNVPVYGPGEDGIQKAIEAVWCNCFEAAIAFHEDTPLCDPAQGGDCCCPNLQAEPGDPFFPCDQLDPRDPEYQKHLETCCGCATENVVDCCECKLELCDGTIISRSEIEQQVRLAMTPPNCISGGCLPEQCINGQCPDGEPCCKKGECIDCKCPDGSDCGGPDCGEPPDWEPPNLECITADQCIVGEPTGPFSEDRCPDAHVGCHAIRNPDTVVLNNGVGLVVYESMEDVSVIKVQQFKTSVGNKILPNREFNYGRLQHFTRWKNHVAKLYIYEDPPKQLLTGTDVGEVGDPEQWKDAIAFKTGPLERQVFPLTIPPCDEDEIGRFISFHTPEGIVLSRRFPSSDDKYDVKWFIYDLEDDGLIGDLNADEEMPPTEGNEFIISSRQVVDDALRLPAHIYNGKRVSIAHPSIATAYNYSNALENSHYVYITYEAFEDSKWNVYLRQLRLSEFKRDTQISEQAEMDLLIPISDLNERESIYRVICTHDECTAVGADTLMSRSVIMEVLLPDGREVLNRGLQGHWPSLCPGFSEGEFQREKVFVKFVHSAVADSCPDQFGFDAIFFNWEVGNEFRVPLTPLIPTALYSLLKKDSESDIGIGNFTTPINLGGVFITSASVGAVWYEDINASIWSVIDAGTFERLSLFKGLDIGEPILLTDGEEGHCIRPIVRANANNDVFIVYESTESDGLQQIVLMGTSHPSSSLPIGVFKGKDLDASLNYFLKPSDFIFRTQITNKGINQSPDMSIDFNDVVHITWQSSRDNFWEIYYASSDANFVNKRITEFESKSLKPRISVNEAAHVFVTWHDDRFGGWEIMMAYLPGRRILPLYQQDPYLASIRNPNYTHTTGLVPLRLVNSSNNTICITNIIVKFYIDRVLEELAFEVSQLDWPFAFQVPGAEFDTTTESFIDFTDWDESLQSDDPYDPYLGGPDIKSISVISALLNRVCLGPGQEIIAYLDLIPDVRIDKFGNEVQEFPIPIGFARNNTYFIAVSATTDSGATIKMPNQFLSVSCESCSGQVSPWNDISCSVEIPIVNESNQTQYYNLQCIFYFDLEKNREVSKLTAFPNNADLRCFTVREGQAAETEWTDKGLKVFAKDSTKVLLWPVLSDTTGLLCGIPYRVEIYTCVANEDDAPCTEADLKLIRTKRWVCNCQSVRWDPRFEDSPINIREIVRWRSSAHGRSDTRITDTVNVSNLNPVIKIRGNEVGVIVYQTNRSDATGSDPTLYKVYASAFSHFPRSDMYATAAQAITSPPQFVVYQSDIPIVDGGGSNPMEGRNISFALDQYDSIFIAVEQPQNQTLCQELTKDKQQIVKVHTCGADDKDLFEDLDELEPEDEECRNIAILDESLVDFEDPVFRSIVRKIRIDSRDVKYHVKRGTKLYPVVDKCNVKFTFVGTPETVAIRLRNGLEEYSQWFPFEPEQGENTLEIPWSLSTGSGFRQVTVQAATNAGLSANTILIIIADYTRVTFDVKFYKPTFGVPLPPQSINPQSFISNSSIFNENNLLPKLEGISVAATRDPKIITDPVTRESRINVPIGDFIFIDIIPEISYFDQFTTDEKTEGEANPVFDFIGQGGQDVFGIPAFYFRTSKGIESFRSAIKIDRDMVNLAKDGLAFIIPHFKKDCSDTSTSEGATAEYIKDKYNLIVPGPTFDPDSHADVWAGKRDKYGRIKHALVIRPTGDDPYFIFGDPNYRIKRNEQD